MKYFGKIAKMDKIIISDPMYKEDVYCRYQNENINMKDLNVQIVINDTVDKYEDIEIKGADFTVLISPQGSGNMLMEDGSFSHYEKDTVRVTEICMDSACIAFGINSYYDIIIQSQKEWQPPIALKTKGDGIFGDVWEGTYDNKIDFIAFTGYLDEETGYSNDDILKYIVANLEITELQKEINNMRFPVFNETKNEPDICDD